MINLLDFSWGAKLPSIIQTEQAECGIACLAMILSYHGNKIDIASLRSKHSISQQGITLESLIMIGEQTNLALRPLKLDLEHLNDLQTPSILHWDMNHFVVLKEVKGGKYIIHDPAIGVRTYNVDKMSKHFTGVAIELTPTQEFKEKKEERRLTFRDMWGGATGLKRSLFQLFLLSLILQIFSLTLPFYMQLFLDDVMVSRDVSLLKILSVGFLLITLMKVFTEFIRSYVVLHLSNKLSFQFASSISRHLLKLPIDYFYKRHMGDLVSRFGSMNNIKDFLASGIVQVVIDGIMVIGTLALMFVYSTYLTFVVLVAVLIYGVVRVFSYRQIRLQNEELLTVSAKENTIFMENISAIQSIKLFGKESDRNILWQHKYADVINTSIKVQKINISIQLVYGILIGVENIVILLLAGFAVFNNELSLGMVFAYISYKDQFFSRVFALLDKLFEFKLLEVHLSRLSDIALEPPEENIFGSGSPTISTNVKSFFRLDNVSYRYSEESPYIFQNINLEVDGNESIAIIGPTGCGKSTLLKIIMSLLQPTSGSVIMSGVNVGQMGLNSYRGKIAGVLQDDTLISGTIFNNITFFDTKPNRERVSYIVGLVGLSQEISLLPMQYETLIGNMGTGLSGGQVQRILLARALYRNSSLLILDEATSQLDLATENIVNHAIKQLQIARIFAAHRPQTIKYADKIYEITNQGLVYVSASQFEEWQLAMQSNEF